MYNMAAYNQNPPSQMNNSSMMNSSGGGTPSAYPAPSLTQPPMGQPMNNGYSHGGRVKKSAMTLAHMSPHELNILDHLQGGTERHNKSGVRVYSHLEELFKNPHLRERFHHHAMEEHHAHGGEVDHMSHESMDHLRHDGRHGDTELALIGPHTHHFFNQMAGHSTRNPQDGHPEYWSLSSALSGLSKGLKGVGGTLSRGLGAIGRGAASFGRAAAPHIGAIGQAALPALTDIATQHLQKHLGDAGGMLGQFGGALGNAAFSKLAGDKPNPVGTAIGEGIGRAATGLNSGQGVAKSIGQGLAHTGQEFGNNAAGNVLHSVGQGLQSGQGARGILSGAAPHATAGAINALMAGKGNRMSQLAPTSSGMQQAAMQRQQAMQELPFHPDNEMAYA